MSGPVLGPMAAALLASLVAGCASSSTFSSYEEETSQLVASLFVGLAGETRQVSQSDAGYERVLAESLRVLFAVENAARGSYASDEYAEVFDESEHVRLDFSRSPALPNYDGDFEFDRADLVFGSSDEAINPGRAYLCGPTNCSDFESSQSMTKLRAAARDAVASP